jgi:hypothetical protein
MLNPFLIPLLFQKEYKKRTQERQPTEKKEIQKKSSLEHKN